MLIWLPFSSLSFSFVPVLLSPYMSFSPLLTFLFFSVHSHSHPPPFNPTFPRFLFPHSSPVAFRWHWRSLSSPLQHFPLTFSITLLELFRLSPEGDRNLASELCRQKPPQRLWWFITPQSCVTIFQKLKPPLIGSIIRNIAANVKRCLSINSAWVVVFMVLKSSLTDFPSTTFPPFLSHNSPSRSPFFEMPELFLYLLSTISFCLSLIVFCH